MNPRLRPILVFLSGAVLLLYVGIFIYFAYAALFGGVGGQELSTSGPLENKANEAVAYVWTTVSLFVGGVVAVAFGQPPPKQGVKNISTEALVVTYAWAFVGVGVAAVLVWVIAGTGKTGISLLIKNAAVAFFGLAVPILTSFLRLPPEQRYAVGQTSMIVGSEQAFGEVEICADFSLFPANTPMPNSFNFSGFEFQKAVGSPAWFIIESGQERGLQFNALGGRVNLPTPVSEVVLRLGTFAGDIEIEAEDELGAIVVTKNIVANNTWSDARIKAPNISSINLRKGGNEGSIGKICVRIVVEERRSLAT